ncbi:hypothetical protein SAMN02910275_02244 [Butyrivibrio sp. INlla18]|uniref:hypothetical protein n=1 Tax=Butyrivibrio sp. INlla18 TaxID=1520806 RepID=UPI0008883366|nr:hypothetical protein [Butyrivibrio sp. INlla18]SDA69946.1 hypothetical protein SAMN02910275_02244 [Butyrivibrio sp. INlla18]
MQKVEKRFWMFAAILSLFVAIIYIFNFFQQARYGSTMQADTYWHIEYVKSLYYDGHLPKGQQGYPLFFYIILGLFLIFRHHTVAVLIFCAVWASVTNLLQIYFIKSLVKDVSNRYALLAGTALSFIWPMTSNVLSIFKLRILSGENVFWKSMIGVYLSSGATAPYQSMTYLCSKPFALLSVLFFYRVFTSKFDKECIKNIVWFSICLFLSVISKPNFYQAFAPAGVIAAIYFFFKKNCKELKRCILVAVAYLPATLWVLYSMTTKIQPIALSPFEGIQYFDKETNILVILGRAIIFILFVGAYMIIKKYRSAIFELAALTYVFGTLEWILLIFPLEKGALDMMWGYNVAMYIFFAAAIVALYEMYLLYKNKIIYVVANVLLGIHAITGVLMFLFTCIIDWAYYLGIL